MASSALTPYRQIEYQRMPKRWKYRLHKQLVIPTGIRPERDCNAGFCRLSTDGVLTIYEGYAWDGPSGPAIDTPNWMRASLVHDALYQLIRVTSLSSTTRKAADVLMYDILIEDGMSRFRAKYSYWGVRAFGRRATKKRKPSAVLTAP